MAKSDPTPSSATTGFFQELPVLSPQYSVRHAEASDDRVFARILSLYLPSDVPHVNEHVQRMARVALDPEVLIHSCDAEVNHPTLRPLSTFGEENKNDPLWTPTGWQKLKEIGYREGVVAVAYDESHTKYNRRIYQFALNHLWGPTSTMTSCPMSMTDGAATLLKRHLEDEDGDQPGRREVFNNVFRRLTSRDPTIAWTSGQWMTERSGGSDVSGTETIATRLTAEALISETLESSVDTVGMPLGPWSIDGFKWFSSATDSNLAILLARTAHGISAFLVPVRRRVASTSASTLISGLNPPQTELNGIRIIRLKNKLGTKSVPTAELELKGTRGWLIGKEGHGIKEISTILNITRLNTAAGSAAGWARSLAICRAYSKVRKVRGGRLQDNAYWASTHFTFFNVALQGAVEQDWDSMTANTKAGRLIPKDKVYVATLLRLLTPVLKARVSVASVHGIRECMECLGGVGYCENNEDGGLMNIAKIYRDNLVNPIWEGTVNVMAEDIIRVLTDKRLGGGKLLEDRSDCSSTLADESKLVQEKLEELLSIAEGASKDELLYQGRDIMELLEAIVCGCLLMFDASTNQSEVAVKVAKRWVQFKVSSEKRGVESGQWKMVSPLEKDIFLGGFGYPQSRQKLR
ncbi:hypothetical protein P280DRAFT_489978 [Massarina eburnea CBS 473.64]|uniref:Acyl-CoA dehydrogenase/oxidase C-terminal n=1 Tax=Massarina eburnea CBS 473.64 TaxID=1395130 RepID=A0A6A6S1B6_9PLEO|nr:hypothetical protein P280DRAFT_489978 [Massarina eburnea CBS 473.64]